MERKRLSREEWIELTKKLRNRVSGYFDEKELDPIDRFVQLAGQGASFDQVSE
jgi:hypothetical protein